MMAALHLGISRSRAMLIYLRLLLWQFKSLLWKRPIIKSLRELHTKCPAGVTSSLTLKVQSTTHSSITKSIKSNGKVKNCGDKTTCGYIWLTQRYAELNSEGKEGHLLRHLPKRIWNQVFTVSFLQYVVKNVYLYKDTLSIWMPLTCPTKCTLLKLPHNVGEKLQNCK